MMWKTNDNTVVHINFPEAWHVARKFGKWDSQKYGICEKGTTIEEAIIYDKTLQECVLIFPDDSIYIRACMSKIREYADNTPQARIRKHRKNMFIVPLSIFKQVPDEFEYDDDIVYC